MLSQIILATLLGITLCGWTRFPQIKIDKFNKTEQAISISTEDFKHLKYPNAFDLELYYQEGLTDEKDISKYQKIEDTYLQQQGCSYSERKIKVEDQMQIQLPDEGKYSFTDMIVVEKSAFVIRNDHKVFSVQLDFNGNELKKLSVSSQHLDFSNQIAINLKKKPQFLVAGQQVFVVTEKGTIGFNFTEWSNGSLPKINFHNLEEVNNIYYVHYDEKFRRMFIVAGIQGVLVYEIKQQELNHLYTININLNIIKVQTKDDQLFLLDDKKGIHFYTITESEYKDSEFLIPLENPISFVYNKNSFLVVAQTGQSSDKIIFGIEILFHFKNQEFYYNKFYLEDMQLKDVQSCGDFQFLIGYDVHKIIQTNVYRGFVDENFDYDTDFMIPLLQKIEEIEGTDYEKANYQYHHSLALTPRHLYGLTIKDRNPEIVCSSQKQIEQSYAILINSTQCEKAETDPFIVCHEEHFINLVVNEVLLDSQSQWYAEVFLIVVFVIFILLLICGYKMCTKWRIIMKNVEATLQSKKGNKQYADLPLGQ
ncbi:unnamed protein product (macronuclear) [Paramecium tetraurelia]|uniref:Transmembrane protein n=1 Tax=Paramecium tetraurelia TaxID=5888 RepID=A0DQ21_PARTE|nr:uncharacterized protein GSPATT00002538001 [Paramecium tetraurelia]CAK85138.1 unnamed protein product [Paramecium tetraurelia]|eukprot:XP_001452535.1 hypothetical protein (macronuclear) [Paramecium tetraurelia strain d4-2]